MADESTLNVVQSLNKKVEPMLTQHVHGYRPRAHSVQSVINHDQAACSWLPITLIEDVGCCMLQMQSDHLQAPLHHDMRVIGVDGLMHQAKCTVHVALARSCSTCCFVLHAVVLVHVASCACYCGYYMLHVVHVTLAGTCYM